MMKNSKPSAMSFEHMSRSISYSLPNILLSTTSVAMSVRTFNEGTLDEWKRVMFEEIANSRDLSIYTGGRKRKSDNEENK